jgi:hypothetical protein
VLEYVVLPLISFASGFASLYIDPRADKAKAWVVVSVLFASALATGIYGYVDGNSHEREIGAARTQAKEQLDVSHRALELQQEGEKKIDQLTESVSSAMRLAHLPESEGDKAPPAGQAPVASPPTVEYFAKNVDGDAIAKATRQAGFDLLRVPGQRPGSTNAIWIGDAISLPEAKTLALGLIREGVQLRSFRRFRDGAGPKSRLIEIGRDEAVVSDPVWTEDRIQTLNSVPPRT